MTAETIRDFWALIAAVVAAVVWVIRLEAGMHKNRSDIRGLERQRAEDIAAQRAAREETNRRIEAMEASVNAQLGEIRTDIKMLLRGQRAQS